MYDDLKLALDLVKAADNITLKNFGEKQKISIKSDGTPVSKVDIETETTIRKLLHQIKPKDEILGEELGGKPNFIGRQWVIDPLDGTKNYLRNIPIWGTLIALLVSGIPQVAVVSAPALARKWWAEKHTGAFTQFLHQSPKRLSVSTINNLTDSGLSFSSLAGWKSRGLLSNFINLTETTNRVRGFGDFYSYMLVAEGSLELALEPEVSVWDLAAPSLIVTAAGGKFTSLNGTPGPQHGSAIATNGLIHEAALKFFSSNSQLL